MNDEWPKPRTKHDWLTAREIDTLRDAFRAGRSTNDIAGELNCSTRIAAKYYARFRGTPLMRGRPKALPTPAPIVPRSRFYKSNFEL